MDALDYFEIRNLVHRYANLLDCGDAEKAGALFEEARFYVEGQSEPFSTPGRNAMAHVFREWIGFFPQVAGRPNTRHVTTNCVIEADGPDRARAQSYVFVFQSGAQRLLEPAAGALYRDRFVKIGGRWRFSERRLSPFGTT